ncbi:MAG: hypothetical protein WEB59_11285 [Thermoanaerobaculia bacterium]
MRACLAKDPEERWQSASDLKRELRYAGRLTVTSDFGFQIPGLR